MTQKDGWVSSNFNCLPGAQDLGKIQHCQGDFCKGYCKDSKGKKVRQKSQLHKHRSKTVNLKCFHHTYTKTR